MQYNYFCCRKHNPPVTLATPQPNNLPGVFAYPKCRRQGCGKTMEFCYSGDDANPPLTPPPVGRPRRRCQLAPLFRGTSRSTRAAERILDTLPRT